MAMSVFAMHAMVYPLHALQKRPSPMAYEWRYLYEVIKQSNVVALLSRLYDVTDKTLMRCLLRCGIKVCLNAAYNSDGCLLERELNAAYIISL